MGLEFKVLGPLEVSGNGRPLALGGRRERVVLASLLLNADRRVSSDELIGALWGEAPPATAATAVQVVISRLRKLLGPGAELRTERGGYLLRIDPARLDLRHFERLVEEGRAALATGQPDAASERLRQALALWRGPALADLAYETFAQSHIARLEELRLVALEERIEAELALGQHGQLAAELTTLVREHPLRERLHRQLMLALYRSGRQADALAAYQEARRRLVGELGLEPATELQELNRRILNHDPELALEPRALPHRTVPTPATSFIGRERELTELRDLLLGSEVRLVTLRGPGGSGKSRLALEAARALRSAFPDGVFFVSLASVHDSAQVLDYVAQALGVLAIAGEEIADAAVRSLRDKQLLLIVDNFDHVVAAAPGLSYILERTESLKLLVTSRAALRLAPEHIVDVPPLGLPESGTRDVDALTRCEAVALFCDRAKAVTASFRLNDENAAHVAEICRRLDGLPLALELAAARTNVLSPEAMLVRMDRRLGLLTGGARDRPARHRTLRETIDWSHDLLGERERRLFRRLAAFVGGCTVDAAASVCGPGEQDVIDGLAELVENSLLHRQDEPRQPEPRFTMLETIREYALERLVESGEAATVRSRHADYFVELAEVAYAQRIGDEAGWAAKLELDHDNLRAALEFLRSADPLRHLQLAGALAWFWDAHSHVREGRERLATAIEHATQRDARLARALAGAGDLASWQGDTEAALAHVESALAIWDEVGDSFERALTLESLAVVHYVAGEMEAAAERAQESAALLRELGQVKLANRAQLELGHALVGQQDVERARAIGEQGLAVALAHDDPRSTHVAYSLLGHCALIRGEYEQARQHYLRSLSAVWQLGDRLQACDELDGVAVALAAGGDARRGLRLAAAAAAAYADVRPEADAPFYARLRDSHLGRARSDLGAEADAIWAEGRQMSLEVAVEEALGSASNARTPIAHEPVSG